MLLMMCLMKGLFRLFFAICTTSNLVIFQCLWEDEVRMKNQGLISPARYLSCQPKTQSYLFHYKTHIYRSNTLLIQMSSFAPQQTHVHIVRPQVFLGRFETLFLPPPPKYYPLPAMWQYPPRPKSLLIPPDYGMLSHSRAIMERGCGRGIAGGEGGGFLGRHAWRFSSSVTDVEFFS